MTGFGMGTAPLDVGRVSVEIRSLNHRYLDVRVRVPAEAQEHAFFVEQACREKLTRGRYDVSLRLEGVEPGSVILDLERGKAAFQSLSALRDAVAPQQEVPLSLLSTVPDLFGPSERLSASGLREALAQACLDGIERLNQMRQREGAALKRELMARLDAARELRDQLNEVAPSLVESSQGRLRERVAKLLVSTDAHLDAGRLELEIALLADKSDIAEELVRLQSHFDQFEQLMKQDEPVGRALDFLLQEIGREANTVASKCQDTHVSHRVVQLKTEIERLREQVQNVE